MVYYLNELSIPSPHCTDSKDEAKELMSKFIEICRNVAKIGFDQLRYEIKLKGICL